MFGSYRTLRRYRIKERVPKGTRNYPAHSTASSFSLHALPTNPCLPGPSSAYNILTPLPPPLEGVNADDLPSYEEMFVETLPNTTDPELYAPKDLLS